jgi:hypothetical protein
LDKKPMPIAEEQRIDLLNQALDEIPDEKK